MKREAFPNWCLIFIFWTSVDGCVQHRAGLSLVVVLNDIPCIRPFIVFDVSGLGGFNHRFRFEHGF